MLGFPRMNSLPSILFAFWVFRLRRWVSRASPLYLGAVHLILHKLNPYTANKRQTARNHEIKPMNELRNGRRPQRRPPNSRTSHANGQRPNGSGNARRNYERYMELAREAAVRGDDVEVQNCYQHAEHYFRTMNGGE